MQLLRRSGESLLLSFLISNSLMTVPLSFLTQRFNSQSCVVSKVILLLLTWVNNEVENQILLKLLQLKEAEEGLDYQTKASDSFASNLFIIFVLRTELAAPVESLPADLGWAWASAPVGGSARNSRASGGSEKVFARPLPSGITAWICFLHCSLSGEACICKQG